MTSAAILPVPAAPVVERLSRSVISLRVEDCPCLPALSATSTALQELLNGDDHCTQQIADVIRRDPSLTSRLLRLVNTVHYGLRSGVSGIDQAVLYLGTRQVRQLVILDPVIEQFGFLEYQHTFNWRHFWKHCIGTAMVTQDLCALVGQFQDDVAYISGLLHDVGKIVMAAAFPNHFMEIRRRIRAGRTDLLAVEEDVLGATHPSLAAEYLEHQRLPEPFRAAARWNQEPDSAMQSPLVAAVHLANLLVRHFGLGESGDPRRPTESECFDSPIWKVLLPMHDSRERSHLRQTLTQTMQRLPLILDGMV